MIKFRCKNCGKKLSVPEIHSGKKGKCPKCKHIVVIPKPESPGPLTNEVRPGDIRVSSKSCPYDLTLLDVPQKDKTAEQPISQRGVPDRVFEDTRELEEASVVDETEVAGRRKLPWLIDIFLYPTSVPGLIILGIIIIIPLLINIVAGLLGPLGFFVAIPGVVIKIVIFLYMYWYFCECIRDSAAGGLRAPDVLVNAPGLGDMLWQLIKIVGCLAFFLAPMLIYFSRTKNTDTIYWSLLGYAVFFFPMGLLAIIMFDSFSALNPLLLIGSIFNTFFPYCAMVLVFVAAAVLTTQIAPKAQESQFLAFILYCLHIYLAMVAAHLLGWFYRRHQEKLNWEV